MAITSCPQMNVSLEQSHGERWIECSQTKNTSEWDKIIGKIRSKGKRLYCCSDSSNFTFRVVIPTCSDVGTLSASSYYLMNNLKNGSTKDYHLIWSGLGNAFEPGKAYEIIVPQGYARKIDDLIIKSFKMLPKKMNNDIICPQQ
jgi:hypothetical protein